VGRQVPPFAESFRAPQPSALRFQIARLYPDQPPALLLGLISGSICGFHLGAKRPVIPFVCVMPKTAPLDTNPLTIRFFKLFSHILFQFLACRSVPMSIPIKTRNQLKDIFNASFLTTAL
jgi:hypothetical protein